MLYLPSNLYLLEGRSGSASYISEQKILYRFSPLINTVSPSVSPVYYLFSLSFRGSINECKCNLIKTGDRDGTNRHNVRCSFLISAWRGTGTGTNVLLVSSDLTRTLRPCPEQNILVRSQTGFLSTM
jgi:hypothetical protein